MATRSIDRRRIVFAHGPWQLLMATAAIRQATPAEAVDRTDDTLVIFSLSAGPGTPELRAVMEGLGQGTWPWRQVLATADPVRDLSKAAVARAVESLRARVGGPDPEEIWLDCLWGGFEKVSAEAFPKARIVLYEDGLHTYVNVEDDHLSIGRCLGHPRQAYRSARARIRQRGDPGDLGWLMLRRHLDRVRASYLWIEEIVPVPAYQRHLPRVHLQTEMVRRTIREAARVAPAPAAVEASDLPRAIVLGQCFSNYGDLPRAQEFDCYLETVTALRKGGFSVLWKEHPRNLEPFLPDLARQIDGIAALPELGPWPIELFAERIGLACCVAVSSTSLFSFPMLFGLPSYTMMNAKLQALFRHPNDQMARIVAACVPSVGRAASLAGDGQGMVSADAEPSGRV